MKNSWGIDWADEGYFKLALVDTEEGTCNMFKLNSWMINHRDNNNLFFDKEPQWSDYDELSESTSTIKRYWQTKNLGGGPITDPEFIFEENTVKSPMQDYIYYELTNT
jgi:hypothetical protein